MIKLVGLKRLILLTILTVLNISVLMGYFLGVAPMWQEADTQLTAVRAEISDLQNKIGTIKQEMTYLKDNLPKYDALKESGFFLSQNRFMIGRKMEDLRVKAGIPSFSFEIGDVEEIPNPDAAAMEHRLVRSRIKVSNIVTPFDNNLYAMMQEASQVFPPYARVQSFDILRTKEVNEVALKDIADEKPVSFVNATFLFDWISLVPKDAEKAPGTQALPEGFRVQ